MKTNDDCVFCGLVEQEKRARMLSRGGWYFEDVIDFEPLNPVVPGHRLFVPMIHVQNAGTAPAVTGRVFSAAAKYASEQNVDFNLITSAGAFATQTVFHLHVHYVPRIFSDGLELPWTKQQRALSAEGRGE